MSQERILKEGIITRSSLSFPAKPIISNECKEFIKRCLEYKADDRYDIVEALNS